MTLDAKIKLADEMISENPDTTVDDFIRQVEELERIEEAAEKYTFIPDKGPRQEYMHRGTRTCRAIRVADEDLSGERILVDFGGERRLVRRKDLRRIKTT